MTGSSNGALLSCAEVTADYGRVRVCHGIDLTLEHPEIVTVLGPNGAGKSSFFGALSGQVHSTGQVSVSGTRVDHLPAHRRARAGLAFVPEGRGNCFGTLSVRENLLIAAQLADTEHRDDALAYVFELFPVIEQRLGQEASTLSGGEQQMLAIGMALVHRPAVLLLDEPSQGLAPLILRDLGRIFARLRADGVGLVVAEQNQGFAARIADRFLILNGGRVVAAGGREELHRDKVADAYLSTTQKRRER